jgi:hypothetical protein
MRQILGISHVATEDQQNHKNEATSSPLSERGAKRRRFAKAGIGATGVFWTLESHATLNQMICKSPSGALSGGLSSHYGPKPVCQGLSPGYWKTHSNWPVSRDILFAGVFDVAGDVRTCNAGTKNKSYLCSTMLNLLSKQSFDKYNLGMHLVATYLNIMSGRINFLSVKTLKEMWRQVQATGTYSPAANVFWNAEQLKNYLQATHD